MTLLIAVLLVSGLTATAQKQYSVFNGEIGQANQPPIEAQEEQMSPVERYIDEIRRCPSCAELWYRLGKARFESGSRLDAMRAFQEAIRLKPDYAEAYNGLGWATQTFFVCGMPGKLSAPPAEVFEDAISKHHRALQLKPDYADAYVGIGYAHIALKQYASAVDAYEQALRLDSDLNDGFETSYRFATFSSLAKCYEELSRVDDAIRVYNELILRTSEYQEEDLDDNEFFEKKFYFLDASMKLASAYSKLGHQYQAIDTYLRVIQVAPDNWAAHYEISLTYVALRDRQSALAHRRTLFDLLNKKLEEVDEQEEDAVRRDNRRATINNLYGESINRLTKEISRMQ